MTGEGVGGISREPRGGHLASRHQAGGVTVNFRIGHLDSMPRCAKCGRALCSHTDAEFKGTAA